MPATVLNLEPQGVVINATYVQGETFSLSLIWKTGDPATPVDLTGYAARMMIRREYQSPSPLLSLTHTSGIALGGAQGTIVITLTAAQTAAMSAGRAVYDAELVSPAGIVTNIVRGVLTSLPNATR
jgi:hypothetical protein